MKFQLKPQQQFIELNKLLQILNITQTGGHSKIVIKNKEVTVNGKTETQIRKKLRQGDVVCINNTNITIT